jgi:hypothetical protein
MLLPLWFADARSSDRGAVSRGLAWTAAAIVAATLWIPSRAQAIPIFAQRYHFKCTVCHSVMPELNAFGNAFRDNGYRLPASVPRHGTTGVALRYQLEYEKDPDGGRRFTPGGVLLSNVDAGQISAFLHYNLGAGGGPSGTYLAFLSLFNEHTNSLYRAGEFELPLPHSPGQRLDDLQAYGFETTHVGLNDLTLASPRIGVQGQRDVGAMHVALTASIGEFKGAAYGGAPIPTGETTRASQPEIGLFVTQHVLGSFNVGAEEIDGDRAINQSGKFFEFGDRYRRTGVWGSFESEHVDALAQQWWGSDANADGRGDLLGSSGGFVRFRYWPLTWHHAFVAARYDAAASPSPLRDWVFYTGIEVATHARIVVQRVQQLDGGPGHFGAALTIGFPWPLGY